MASEPVDLALIHDEELLRRMWQQTEDFGRKKEIRAHMYKLRETRLRDFYTGDMDATIGMGKGLGGSHGDSLQDQSFESFKTKEIRDSESPTRDYKFDVVAPDTSGWNVITSSEVTNEGKTHTTQSLATTAGAQDIPGGKTSFSGRNEQLSSVTHEGDDNNYKTTAGQSSDTLLQESSVTGDENSGRSESKSTSVTSSSRVIKSQHTSSGDQATRDHRTVADDFDEMLQSTRNTSNVQQSTNTEQESKISTASKQSTTTEMSAEAHQKEVERLAALPGEIISRKIDYPDANTKMITETKALDDGTIVTTRKYETRSASSKVWSSASTKQESSSSRSITEERAQKQRVECVRNDQEVAEKSHETLQRDRETTQQQTLKDDTTVVREEYAPSEVSESNRTFEFTEELTERHEDSFQTKKDYRQDHTSKRVSVEVDAAHDAFARSLRSISPDRGSTRSSTTRINTDRSQQSRRSPSRESDTSRISSNTVTKSKSDLTSHDYQRSTISSERRQMRGSTPTTKRPSTVAEKTDEPRDRVPVKEPSPVRRPTQAKDTKQAKNQPIKDFETDSARSTSPTSTVSDIVYHQGDNRRIVTDLDTEEVSEVKKSTQEESTSTTIETSVAEGYGDEGSDKRSKTPTAQPRRSSIKKTTEEVTETEETSETSKRHKLSRSETYEERCRQILGMSDKDEIQAKGEENLTNILAAMETQEKTNTQDTVDFLANEINHEKTTRKMSAPSKKTPASSPERKQSVKAPETKEEKPKSPERKTSVKKTPVRKSSKNEIKKESVTEITQSSKTVTKKDDKTTKTLGERKKSTGLETKDTKHVSTAKITISPVASKTKPKDEKPVTKKTKKITHSDYSSEAEDSEKEIPASDKTPSRRVNKLPVVERKESAPVYSNRQEKDSVHKMARSTSENTFRSSARKRSKPDMPEISKSPEKTTKGETKRPTKCITTKTINLTATSHTETAKAEDVDVIVDIQQAKSSREPTPNRIIPVPVSPEEDTGKPRYPDAVHEPDDMRRQSKVKNIPIYEEETSDYIGCSITEVAEEDATVSVTDKVNLFSTLKESSNYEKSFLKESSVDVDEEMHDDECLLSVSDKVSKFISSAEEVKKIRTSAPFSPDHDRDDSIRVDEECLLSVTDKVTKFISTAEDVKKPKVSAPFKPESRLENGDSITDESQLSVTEKVTKFRTRAEKLAETAPQRSPELVAKIDKQVSRSKPPSVDKVSEEEFGDIEEEKTRRTSVKDRYSPREKPVTTSPITLRSTEIVKKAKAVFEQNKSPAKSRDILSRPSVWEGKKTTKLADIGVKEDTPKPEGFFLTEPGNRDTPRELDRAFQNIEKSPSDSIPSYMKDAVATRKHIFEKKISSSRLETEKIRRKSQDVERKISKPSEEIEPVVEEMCVKKVAYQTPPLESVGVKRSLFERKDSLPSYMSPTVSSLEHSNTQRKDSIDINKSNLRKTSMEKREEELADGNPRSTVKFGVALKRTDSETSQPRRKSSCPEVPHIEEIFELELLERMLETVVGYEQRRRIRAQIRLVKKQMETTPVRKVSPTRKLSPRKISGRPTEVPDHIQLNGHKEIETIEIQEKHISRSPSPPKSLPNLRQMRQVTTETRDDKPIWATKNILKKASESSRTYASRRVVSETKSRVKTETPTEPKSIDSVTSSYGIGPTDDNGQPLFGLRALKKKTPGSSDSTTKVSGSIIRESYHSVNGADPVGQRSVTLYSSDPADFDQIGADRKTPSQIRDKLMESEHSRKIHSVTKTQKMGGETSPKVVRRGSVKELSEKFIQKEAAIQDKGTTQNYPKAGLILRSQTSREDRRDSDSRSSTLTKSPEKQQGKVVVTKTQTMTGDGGLKTTTTKETRSFLNCASSKVTDVQDVLDRMRNADNVEEAQDSADDREARALLNKFIGASVLMAGMESMMPQQMSKIVGAPVEKQQVGKSTTKSAKTTTSTKKRPTNIDEIWDEVLLKQLLEQTTNYEERRKLRARLKQVMAEKEACADIIASVKRELKEQELEESDEYEVVEEEEETVEEEEEEEESVEEEESIEEEEVVEEATTTSKVAPPPQVAPVASKGESLLLPLLQGLLHKKSPQRSNSNQSTNDECAVHVEDSGTESGEDLKLLAAGLHDTMSTSRGAGVDQELLLDVTTALDRLEASLRDGKDVNLDVHKRSTLLGLVSRLQTGLASPDKISPQENDLSSPEEPSRPDRRPFGGARFNKRRTRQNRHTVGVSREELADARRFMEDMIMRENHSSTGTPEATIPPEFPYNLQKQASAGTLLTTEPTTVLHRPKEFVQELPVVMRDRKPKFKFMRQSLSLDASVVDELPPPGRQYHESISVDSSQVRQSIHDAVHRAKNKILDEKNLHNKVKHSGKKNARSRTPPASAAQRLLEIATSDENCRFTKKQKMKRANTIDIPKPLKIALAESDDALSENEFLNKPTQNQGLKTPIRVGDKKTSGKTVVPTFMPKTENDHKFLAFINKQTTTNGPSWTKPDGHIETKQKQHNWSNKFGNIKNTFENVPKPLGGMKVTSPGGGNSARNFWRTTESTTVYQKPLLPPPKKGVSTKIEKFESPLIIPKPIHVNKFSHAPMSAFKPPPSKRIQQIPPFKPIAPEAIPHTVHLPQPTNTTVKQLTNGFRDEPLGKSVLKPGSSPTRNLANYQFNTSSAAKSPTNILPWTAKVVPEKRVLNLAAQKFEAPPPPRKLSPLSPRSQSMKYRATETFQAPVNTRLIEKRPSLPSKDFPFLADNETYNNTQMNENTFQVNPSYIAPKKLMGSVPNLTEMSYTVTDYTPPRVSTCVPQWTVDSPQDSITNPNAEPLVLTCDRPVYSPKQETLKIFDYPSPVSLSPAKSSNDDWDDDQDLTDSTEYKAVSSRVMTGPICHSAVTVTHKTSRLGDEDPHGKGSSAAKSLHTVLKTIKSPVRSPVKARKSPPSPLVIKPQIVETPATPPSHVIYNNVSQRPSAPYALSKSDSWHQICANSNRQPSPKHFVADNRGLQRAKSNHNLLSVPKQFEAGIARDQVTEKQKTVAAYFSGQKSPTNVSSMVSKKTTINRVRTSSKASINNQNPSSGLARSHTMPHMAFAQMHLLDEDNVEDAFEDLFNSSLS